MSLDDFEQISGFVLFESKTVLVSLSENIWVKKVLLFQLYQQ